MDLAKETELAVAMLNAFGAQAFQRASDFAYIESLMSDEAATARWRRVMVLIKDLSTAGWIDPGLAGVNNGARAGALIAPNTH